MGAPFATAMPDDFWEDAALVTLHPGDVLYTPAGMWHRVECVDDSVSINVSLMGATWADLIADAAERRHTRS